MNTFIRSCRTQLVADTVAITFLLVVQIVLVYLLWMKDHFFIPPELLIAGFIETVLVTLFLQVVAVVQLLLVTWGIFGFCTHQAKSKGDKGCRVDVKDLFFGVLYIPFCLSGAFLTATASRPWSTRPLEGGAEIFVRTVPLTLVVFTVIPGVYVVYHGSQSPLLRYPTRTTRSSVSPAALGTARIGIFVGHDLKLVVTGLLLLPLYILLIMDLGKLMTIITFVLATLTGAGIIILLTYSKRTYPIRGPGKRPHAPSPLSQEEKQAKRAKAVARATAKRLKKQRGHIPEVCSPEDVRWTDIVSLLGQDVVDKAAEDGSEFNSPFLFKSEVELEVKAISSNDLQVRAWPNQTKRIRNPGWLLSLSAFLVNALNAGDDERVNCKYFSKCGGCQYQMLSYETQLAFKRNVVVKAYKNYSGLPQSVIPEIQSTIGSPLQYGYRTKITPHFQAPPPKVDRIALQAQVESGDKPDWLQIGFNIQSQNKVFDIEECPIATPVLNRALPEIFQNVVKTIHTYKKGATLLLRESLDTSVDPDPNDTSKDTKLCITNNHASIRERVGGFLFEYVASSFFQNNNAILPALTSYVREAIASLYPDPNDSSRPTHLIDTYCGSGLFAITLSPDFSTVAGIEISADSILYAKRNAKLNGIAAEKMTFRKGDAAEIFKTVSDFPPEKTVMEELSGAYRPPRKFNLVQQVAIGF
ncbi:trna partial [Lentinula edodes]|uniref:Trna partial n=1 Tax=Lentinula edodes TaxID=5353 RepID=A0A1Q3ED73_LENED|nr:trna partial [Lentinula edodes]